MFTVHFCDVQLVMFFFFFKPFFQRLTQELPLSAEELDNVFDSLDLDRNGFLTLEEFSSGFSKFTQKKKKLDCGFKCKVLRNI